MHYHDERFSFMSKKAMSIETLGILAVFVILLVVMVITAIRAGAGTNKYVEDSECANSIKTHSFLLKTTGEAVVTDIYCPTKYYTVSGKDADETKHSLAEAMKTCWGTWGRGQLDLFKEEGYYCQMCSVIDFKDDDKTITGFSDYLVNTPIEPGSDLSYVDYLSGYSSKKADPDFAQQYRQLRSTGSIDTSKTYAVMFLYAKGDKFIKSLLEGFGSVTGSATTSAGGAVIGGISGAAVGILVAKGAAVIGLGVSTGGAALVGIAAVGVAGFIWGLTKADEVEWFSLTMLQEYNNESLREIGCKINPVKQDKIQGVGG
jgi:hypothetical protein